MACTRLGVDYTFSILTISLLKGCNVNSVWLSPHRAGMSKVTILDIGFRMIKITIQPPWIDILVGAQSASIDVLVGPQLTGL